MVKFWELNRSQKDALSSILRNFALGQMAFFGYTSLKGGWWVEVLLSAVAFLVLNYLALALLSDKIGDENE